MTGMKEQHGAATSNLDFLVDFLSSDDRPTFVLDLKNPELAAISFVNAALEQFLTLCSPEDFTSWIANLPPLFAVDGTVQDSTFAGRVWRCKCLHQQSCAIIYAAGELHATTSNISSTRDAYLSTTDDYNVTHYEDDHLSKWVLDWTRFECAAISPWTKYMRSLPWGNTRAGPMHTWPAELRQLLVMQTASAHPRAIEWTEVGISFVNEAASPLLGNKLEEFLGSAVPETYGQKVYDQNREVLRKGLIDSRPADLRRLKYTYAPFGCLQDFYFDMGVLPVCGKDGRFIAKAFEWIDVTETVVREYRDELMLNILERITTCRDLDQLWDALADPFKSSQLYLPYALVYACPHDHTSRAVNPDHKPDHKLDLKRTIGITTESVPTSIDMSTIHGARMAQALTRATESDGIQVLQLEDGTLPQQLAITMADGRRIIAACIIPVSRHDDEDPLGFIVLGINPLQPFLAADVKWMDYLRDTISKTASIIAMPDDLRDKDELGILHERIKQEMHALTAEKNESAFATLARDAPCGMFVLNRDGSPSFLNQKWLELTAFSSFEQVREIAKTRSPWADMLSKEDWERQETAPFGSIIARTFNDGVALRSEHRLIFPRDPSRPEGAERFNRWVEGITIPEFDAAHRVTRMIGFLIDISDRKRSEEIQKQQQAQKTADQQRAQQLQDAIANKKAADSFIDIISHELRNPLSAILQLAEGIVPAVQTLLSDSQETKDAEPVSDAAKTITLCARHMKTIVDDVLTLSKLDSSLLTLSLEQDDPGDIAARALKIYEAECTAAQITTSLKIEDSYNALVTEPVLIDRGRTLQVLLNLISNAIKFTRDADIKKINLSIAAYKTAPTEKEAKLRYAEKESHKPLTVPEQTSTSDPQSLEDVFVQFTVTDTGRGITQEEISRLFQRFSQGSAKTYTQYGGSGLGLFITRKLTELHGGQVGVKSDGLDHGSTFAFYIKVKQTTKQAESKANPPQPATRPSRENVKAAERSISESSATTMKPGEQPLHILLVEDNIINQTIVAKQLRQHGHTVHVANHGKEALAFLRTTLSYREEPTSPFPLPSPPPASSSVSSPPEPPALSIILMDVEMPVMNGLDCTRRIRELEETGNLSGHVPIIAITANARREQVEHAMECGVDHVITKPFRISALLAAMQERMRRVAGDPAG